MSPEISHPPQLTSAKPKPAKAVKPRKMWLLRHRRIEGIENYLSPTKEYSDQSPVLVFDLSTESVEAEYQKARASVGNWGGGSHDDTIREVFRSLGLVPPAKRPTRKRRGAK